MTCSGNDVISPELLIPTDLKVGDWLCIGGMGAYGYGSGGSFNGMKSTEHIIRWSGVIESEEQRVSSENVSEETQTPLLGQ